jgi:hypothetical protein
MSNKWVYIKTQERVEKEAKMAHEETIYGLMEQLVIADKHVVGDLMANKELWTAGVSAVNNSYKALNTLVDAGRMERGDGYFRLPGCKSEYKEHAQLLTKSLAEILKIKINSKIVREATLNEIGLRPDALVLLTKENQALCFILEVCNNEFPEFLQQKVNAWKQWDGSLEILSQLFKTKIKAFDIVVSGDITADGTLEFNQYLEEVAK